MIRLGRVLVAVAVALLALLVAQWFDAGVLADAQRQGSATFQLGSVFYLMTVAHLLTAAGVVALALAAWWSRSLIVGVGYAVFGGVLALLPALFQAFATGVNDAPPLAPEPIASTLTSWFLSASTGVTGSIFTLGAAMLLSGLAVIGSMFRRPRSTADVAEASASVARPEPV